MPVKNSNNNLGNKLGILYIFEVNEFNWNLITKLYDHNKEITYISVSNALNVFATSSLDGFVNLYTFPNNRLFRSIYLIGDIDITADYVNTTIILGIPIKYSIGLLCCLFKNYSCILLL
jgi:WD40 repeat protein